ncbi:MAG: hypothetical protein ABI467_10920 [Kofleriaceae bacterium]
MTRILDGLPEAGESVQRAFDRKERELCALFATLAPVECWALHSALSTGDRGNGVVQRVARLTSERRARLIGFIATAARRKVVAK